MKDKPTPPSSLEVKKTRSRTRAFMPDPDTPTGHICDMPGCLKQAGYKAPRSPNTLREYYWFCLEHIREYNAKWDFYKGMTPRQIEDHLKSDTSWGRPSWKLGHLGAKNVFDDENILDPLDILGAAQRTRAAQQRKRHNRHHGAPPSLHRPLDQLDLKWPLSLDELKNRYKSLARQHHPDANNGSRESEEKLKEINIAYSTLKAHLIRNGEPTSSQKPAETGTSGR